jgi:hypothetical protein
METMINTFVDTWQAADQCRLPGEALEDLQAPVVTNKMRIPGITLTNRRLMTVLSTAVEMAKQPDGFIAAELYPRVIDGLGDETYTKSQLTYDLRKLKAKGLIEKIPHRQRYRFPFSGLQKAVGLLVFHKEILQPILSTVHLTKKPGPKPRLSYRDQLYRNIQINLEALCIDYGLKQAA